MTHTRISKPYVPIIIGSCNRYAEVLSKVYVSIKTLLPNQPVWIVSDASVCIEASDYLLVTPDQGWNNNLLSLVADLPDSAHVIVTMDDLLVTWCDNRFGSVIDQLIQEGFDYVSLYAPPAAKLRRALLSDFKSFSDVSSDYAISTMVSLIRVGLLRTLLRQTDSPWSFERRSCRFTAHHRCINLNYNLVVVSNLIVKGRRIQWRSPEMKLGLIDKAFSVQYAFKVLGYSVKQLWGVNFGKFLLK